MLRENEFTIDRLNSPKALKRRFFNDSASDAKKEDTNQSNNYILAPKKSSQEDDSVPETPRSPNKPMESPVESPKESRTSSIKGSRAVDQLSRNCGSNFGLSRHNHKSSFKELDVWWWMVACLMCTPWIMIWLAPYISTNALHPMKLFILDYTKSQFEHSNQASLFDSISSLKPRLNISGKKLISNFFSNLSYF